MPAREVGKVQADKTVDSVCPYCGVGCLLTYNVKGNKILWVQGREGPANSNRLCVKGRYGFDYVQHKHRLTKPLIRKPSMKKHKDFTVDHCTRLCHASSVAALIEGINSVAGSNQVRDVMKAEVIFLNGANPTVNHPVAATWMKNAAKAGVKLIVADPRK